MRKQIVAVEQQHQQILERIEDMGDECVATKRNHISEQLQIFNDRASDYFQRGL